MTALDQAFIKAYMHHGSAPVAATLSSAKPVRLTEALAEAPKPEPSELPPEARADSRAVAVTAALEKPPARSRTTTSRPRSEPGEPSRRATKGSGSKSGSGRRGKSSEPQVIKATGTPLLDGLGIPPVRPAAGDKPALDAELPKAVEAATPVAPPAAATSTPEPFQPAFQVDRFLWSQGCTRLSTAAVDQLDRLAEGISNRPLPGQRVVGMCGCRRGDGCTTLLLCVARRLAAQGRRVLLLDAHFEQPMLARRLGLLPEMGWEDVLWRGLPLAEATIESLEDRLALLPLRGGSSHAGSGELDPTADMAKLSQHYDLVLVDLGRFDLASPKTSAVFRSAPRWVNSVVIVHNVRNTPQPELENVRRWLRELGLCEAGIAENFV